jgi:hypothetical protein
VNQGNKIKSEDKGHQLIGYIHFGETEEDVRLGCENMLTVRISGSQNRKESGHQVVLPGCASCPQGEC